MFGDDPVDLIGQEDKVDQSDSSLEMPLGVRDDGVAPVLTWQTLEKVSIHLMLKILRKNWG